MNVWRSGTLPDHRARLTLLATQRVMAVNGLARGLDTLLFPPGA